jgi:hypothetical protein
MRWRRSAGKTSTGQIPDSPAGFPESWGDQQKAPDDAGPSNCGSWGHSVFGNHRVAELVVDAHANDIGVPVNRVGKHVGRRGGDASCAPLFIAVFAL